MNESTPDQSLTLMQKLRLRWTRFWTQKSVASSELTQEISKMNKFVGSQWGIRARKGPAKLSGSFLRFPPTYLMPAVAITRFVKLRPSSNLTATVLTPQKETNEDLVDDEGMFLNVEDEDEEFSRASSRTSSIVDSFSRQSSSRNSSVANIARAPSQSEGGNRTRSSSVTRRSRGQSNVGLAPAVDTDPSKTSNGCDGCSSDFFTCFNAQSKKKFFAGDFQDKKSYELPHHIRNYKSKLAKRFKEQVRLMFLLRHSFIC
jgi:hypothetical protein